MVSHVFHPGALFSDWRLLGSNFPLIPALSAGQSFQLGNSILWIPALGVPFNPVQSLSRVWLCNPTDCSTPGLPVHHQHPELTQNHVHWVSDAIQPSLPLSSSSPPASNPSQHQGLFKWVSSLHQAVKVLKFQLQHQSFQWILRIDLL